MWACQQFVLLKFLSNLNLNMVYGTFYVNHDIFSWACQQFVLLKFLSNLNLNMVYGTFYVNHDVSKCRFSCLQIYIKPWMLVILLCDRLDCNESGVVFFLCVFLFFFFFQPTIVDFVNCEQFIHALFIGLTNSTFQQLFH